MNYFLLLLTKAHTAQYDETISKNEREFAAALVSLNQDYKIILSEYELLKLQVERERK